MSFSQPPPEPAARRPANPEARRLTAICRLRLRGRGRIVLTLKGAGHVRLRRGRFDDFCFEGRGLPRHVSAAHVHLAGATGRLVLEGDHLELEFSGGRADVEFSGVFDLEEGGPGTRAHAA